MEAAGPGTPLSDRNRDDAAGRLWLALPLAARRHWLISHVYAVLGDGRNALQWAQTCATLTDEHAGETRDFDVAYAQEALARAHAATGHPDEARRHHGLARTLGDQIADAEDRKIFDADFGAGPWFGVVG